MSRQQSVSRQLQKAVIKKRDSGAETEVLKVQFNPESYSLKRSTSYTEIIPIGRDAEEGKIQFKNNGFYELSVSLFFDNYDTKLDVRDKVKKLSKFLTKNIQTKLPDEIIFAWGTFVFQGVLESINENYTMFDSTGTPIRAKLDLSIKGKIVDGTSGSTSNAKVEQKVETVVGNTQLWEIAEREFGDASYWKQIADNNEILNPRKLSAADQIKVR